MVSYLSIIFMAITAVVSIGLPIVLFLLWRKRHGLKLVPALVGAAAFVVFALVLERLLHMLVLRPGAGGSYALLEYSPPLFILYGAFAAGVFEETGRFIALSFLKKKYSGVGTGLAYGIGHGGIEAILIAGLSMISSIVMSVMINSGNVAPLGDSPVVAAQIEALIGMSPFTFLLAGLERITAITLHISLSVLVWRAVTAKGKMWYYPLAILLHAMADISAAMYQVGIIITNVYAVEGIILVFTVLVAVAVYLMVKKSKGESGNESISVNVSESENVSASECICESEGDGEDEVERECESESENISESEVCSVGEVEGECEEDCEGDSDVELNTDAGTASTDYH